MAGRLGGSGISFRYVPDLFGIELAANTVGTEALRALVYEMVDIAQMIAPVDTGAYRDSIQGGLQGMTPAGPVAALYSDIRYAPFLEFGTDDRPQGGSNPTYATLRQASEMANLPSIGFVI